MCMFCAALPMVVGATAVAQGEQRKKMQAAESRKQQLSSEIKTMPAVQRAETKKVWLTPRRITQLGAVAFVVLLFGSGFYHTHFPG
jgi:hypothetical protein